MSAFGGEKDNQTNEFAIAFLSSSNTRYRERSMKESVAQRRYRCKAVYARVSASDRVQYVDSADHKAIFIQAYATYRLCTVGTPLKG